MAPGAAAATAAPARYENGRANEVPARTLEAVPIRFQRDTEDLEIEKIPREKLGNDLCHVLNLNAQLFSEFLRAVDHRKLLTP